MTMYHGHERELGSHEAKSEASGSGIEPPPLPQPPPQPRPPAELPSLAPALSQMLTVAASLVGVLDLDELCRDVMGRVVQVFPAIDAGILWLYEWRAGKLRVASVAGLPLDAPTLETLKMCQIAPGEALAGQVFQQNELLYVMRKTGYHTVAEYASASNRALAQQMTEQLPHTLLIVGVPLRKGSEVIGVMELLALHPYGDDDRDEQGRDQGRESEGARAGNYLLDLLTATTPPRYPQVLQTFANLMAAIIKNASLYEESQQRCRRLRAFDAVVTAISSATDLQSLMVGVLDVVTGELPVSSGAIFVLDPASSWLMLGSHRGLPPDYVRSVQSFPVAGAPCEEVVLYGQPTVRLLMAERGEGALLATGLESGGYLPLLAGGTVVGVMGLYGDARLPKQINVNALMPLSNQVGFAIANVRLYEASHLERQKLTAVINSIAEGVILCDSKGRLVLANEAAMALLGLDTIPFGQPLSEMPDFYHIRDLDQQPVPVDLLPMARALAGEVFHDYRLLLQGASGSNTVISFSGAPTRSDGGGTIEGAVVVLRDITASQKLERAKDEFLAVTAHELRSPLASVRSYADMLLNRKWQSSDADPRDVRGLTILSQQVTHMLRMVDNLLDVSRLDAGRIELQTQPVNLVSLANQVLDQRRPEAANRELLLETDLPEFLVQCDQMRIRQVLTNLVGNAIKYSPAESRITVQLREVERDGQKEALVSVSDKGTCIPKEQQARLFQRFQRGGNRRRIEGLGLGLYLCREFVQMHGGRIWLESVEGSGNTFSFTLPLIPVSDE
ncbi:MAG: GAF domain-containing protein [Chloroflexaceae bacterium]|nr:GAF domain-containing protein [Chloroflexaceae bacterium]